MNKLIRAGLAALAISAVPVLSHAQDLDNSQTNSAQREDDDFDLGWLGLIGLAGLLGLRRKEPTVNHTPNERVAPRV